jgi:hypothetical protein
MGNRARDGQGIPKGRDRVGHGWAIDGKGSKNSKEKGSSKEEGGGPSASWARMEVFARIKHASILHQSINKANNIH